MAVATPRPIVAVGFDGSAPAEALVSATQAVQLLVVGNRGRSDLVSTVLGSVSFAVTAHTQCPVVVVREGTAPLGPQHGVVVGVDRSSAGNRALDLPRDGCSGIALRPARVLAP